jgi:hypothetical protein
MSIADVRPPAGVVAETWNLHGLTRRKQDVLA